MVAEVHKMMAAKENISHTKVPPGQDQVTFMIPKVSVGVVIGKSGETINRIQEATQTRIQFVPDDPKITDRGCYIIGPKEGKLIDCAFYSYKILNFRMFESPRRSFRNCQKENGRSELDQCSYAKGKSTLTSPLADKNRQFHVTVPGLNYIISLFSMENVMSKEIMRKWEVVLNNK